MHKRILYLAAGIAQAVLFSCSKENDIHPPSIQVIPLRVGNQWQYREFRYDRNGSLTDSSTLVTRSVLRDTLINGSTWYVLNNKTVVQNTAQGYAYYNAASKQAVLIYQGEEMGGVGYGYTYPTYKLFMYTVPNHQLQPVPGSRQKFVGNQYKVDYQYTYTNPSALQTVKREDWVVPAIGLVRWDYFYPDSDVLQRRWELVSYLVQ